MASTYPGAIDSVADPGTTLNGPPSHSDLHELLASCVVAIEGELGTNPSSTYATVAARLDALPRGVVASVSPSALASLPSSGTMQDTPLSVSFTAIAGRRYRIEAAANVVQNGGSVAYQLVADSTVLARREAPIGASTRFPLQLAQMWAGAGAVTVKLQIQSTLASSFTNDGGTSWGHLVIEDLGAV